MSLFGFVKDIGNRIFDRDEDAADKIKDMILANNPGVKELEVDFDDGFVSLCGECTSEEARQKVVLMAGNVQGVKDVTATKLTVDKPAAPEPAPAPAAPKAAPAPAAADDKVEFYTIKSGDTLSKIAKTYYGDPMAYTRIFDANREVIQDPDKIFVGQKIRIPLA